MRPTPRYTLREDASTVAILVLAGAACAMSSGAPPQMAIVAALAVLALVGLAAHRMPRRLAVIAIPMALVAAVLLPFAETPLVALKRGLNIGGIFVAMLASVSMLVAAARRSSLFQSISASLYRPDLPAPTLWLTGVAHLFPSLLNVGGAVLLCEMASTRFEAEGRAAPLPVLAVIHRGFLAACNWSPIFGNLALILLAYPSLAWPDVAPYGLALGVLVSAVSLIVGPRLPRPVAPRGTVALELARGLAPLIALMSLFLGSCLLLHAVLHLPTVVLIVILTPLYGLLCHRLLVSTTREAVGEFVGDARRLMPNFAPETLFFAAGGTMMMVLSDVVPESALLTVGSWTAGSPALSIALLLGLSVAIAAAGIHPFLTALLLADTLSPATLGLSPLAHFMTVLFASAIAFGSSPYTLLSLLVSRYSQRSPFALVYRLNGPFLLAVLLAGGLTLWVIDRLA